MAGRKSGLRQFLFYNMRKSNFKTSHFDNFDETYYTTDGYDDYLTRFKEEGNDLVSRLIKVIEPDSSWYFLDVGCGMGGTILALRELKYKAWGIETSSFCLERSPAKNWMKAGNVCKLSYKDNSFNVVICMDVLCYLNKQKAIQASKELVRVAKHYLYIESVCKGSPNSNQRLNPDLLRKDRDLLTKNELKRMFENNDTLFLKPLYTKKESPDFNGVFVK